MVEERGEGGLKGLSDAVFLDRGCACDIYTSPSKQLETIKVAIKINSRRNKEIRAAGMERREQVHL